MFWLRSFNKVEVVIMWFYIMLQLYTNIYRTLFLFSCYFAFGTMLMLCFSLNLMKHSREKYSRRLILKVLFLIKVKKKI